jgi:hypothetical protein
MLRRMPEPDPRPSRVARVGLLLAILALAAALRFAGIGFGLSPTEVGPTLHPLARPDEQYLWNLGLGIYAGDPNPHFFLYPTLLPNALAVADAAAVALASWVLGSREAVEQELLRDPRALILIDRGIVAAIGAASVLLVHRLAAAAFGWGTGIVAAGLLAVAHLHVRDSHFGVTDVPLAALVCAALLPALRIASRGQRRDYALAGLLTGLATSTKYSGVLLLPALVAADLLGRAGAAARPLHRLPMALALVALGFLAGTPFALLAWPEFRDGVVAQLDAQAGPDWLGVELGSGWWQHLRFTLWHGLGPPLLLASLAGVVVALARAPRPALVLLAFAVPYMLVLGRGPLVFARYMVPLVPILCITAAVGLVAAVEWLPRRRLAASLLLAALVAAPSLRASIDLDRVLMRADSRVLAAHWLRARLRPDDSVFLVGAVFGDPPVPLRGRKVYDPYPWPPRVWADRLSLPPGPRHRRVRNAMDPAFDSIAADESVTWIVVAEGPLLAYGPTASLEWRLPGYRKVASFEGVGDHPEMRFDLQDAFYVPFAGIGHALRPGPNLHVYRRGAEDLE